MPSLPSSYLAEVARQVAFLSAFLGGFAATFLATLVVAKSSKRSVGWAIGFSAFAASCFIVAVISSVMLTTTLHPDAPGYVSAGVPVNMARVVSVLGFGLGAYALLGSVGISGWIRSRRLGLVTSIFAGVGAILVSMSIVSVG